MALLATLRESSQRIVIKPNVIAHMARHRQLSWFSREAGGQLFGAIRSDEVVILAATGPYRGDQRSRSSYRSNAKSAQRAIDLNAKNGLFYLGEWHTHPEEHPVASADDRSAMSKLLRASSTRLETLLMIIQARQGVAIYSFGAQGFVEWTVSDGAVLHACEEHR
ncbi:Mov34/MPN/PAD-1 family protein [Pseudoxanthomonas mexicana]|uniref:Mov34/MPN/PAD-1 family protein n=1 Tax=Pseudoxanthomonas mexicana TaxID=128785 RepID=A0ABX6RC93_PSEMX|nr:Mov34/MPN/PAD-1 family protein [Pseudoxanthomonas mexicana]QND80534.1 Mov34/MPN/PAD-1 family protein [Pseudoxanthomonas mexicana]